VTALKDTFKVENVAPGHCTGEPTFAALKQAFGNRYIYAGVGTSLLLGPNTGNSERRGEGPALEKRTSSLRIASSPAAKTPSASFRRVVRDHAFCVPKASNGSAIVNRGTTKFDPVVNTIACKTTRPRPAACSRSPTRSSSKLGRAFSGASCCTCSRRVMAHSCPKPMQRNVRSW
jgi:hypothetical protein